MLGRCSGSEFVDFAAASSRAIGEFVSARRPSHMPIIAAATHQPMTKLAEHRVVLASSRPARSSSPARSPTRHRAGPPRGGSRRSACGRPLRRQGPEQLDARRRARRRAGRRPPRARSGVSSERTPTQIAAPSLPSSTSSRRPANASRSVMSSPTYRAAARSRPSSRRRAPRPLLISTGGRSSSTLRPQWIHRPSACALLGDRAHGALGGVLVGRAAPVKGHDRSLVLAAHAQALHLGACRRRSAKSRTWRSWAATSGSISGSVPPGSSSSAPWLPT